MKKMNVSEQEIKIIRESLSYDPETGIFQWLIPGRGRPVGKSAGGFSFSKQRNTAYRSILIMKKRYACHRLAWLIVYGELPSQQIDHINLDGTDNRIANLRLATPRQNQFNRRMQGNSRNPYKGIAKNRNRNKWQARIRIEGRRISLGYYSTPEEAHQAYCVAARKAFGEFARSGRRLLPVSLIHLLPVPAE